MEMYKKILVPFDGSPSGRWALMEALQMAKTNKSWVKALAIVPDYAGDLELFGVSNIKETIEGPGRKLVSEAKEMAASQGIPLLADFEQGEPYERIVHVAEEERCDLIVMGRHGLSHVERELMGSVTARVIGHTNKDVLVVPEGARIAWGNILLATDGSRFSESATKRAIEIAQGSSSRITAVSVVPAELLPEAPAAAVDMTERAKAVLESVKEKAASSGVEVEILIREGDPHLVIHDVASQIHADVILMGSHGRKGLTRLLMGSVTERVIGYSFIPVLVVHATT